MSDERRRPIANTERPPRRVDGPSHPPLAAALLVLGVVVLLVIISVASL